MTYIKFGLSFSPSEDWTALRRRWRLFESYPQVDSLFVVDHQVRTGKPESPYRDCWTLLPALAAQTQRCMIGPIVTSNMLRHPMVLARAMLTVDEISNGRLIMGMGAGWYVPEHEILGIPYLKRSVSALESTLKRLTRVRDFEVVNALQDEYLPVRHFIARPRPIGPIPIMVAGHGPKILGLVSEYAQIWNSFGTPAEMLHRIEGIQNLCAGNLPELTINIWRGLVSGIPDVWDSEQAFQDVMGMYQDVGLTGWTFDAPRPNQMPTFEKVLNDLNI